MRLPLRLCAAALLAMTPTADAATYAQYQAKSPELFHEQTGYRIERQRAPTPEDIPPPARLVNAQTARSLIEDGALPIDVFGALQSRFDELEGTWLVNGPRLSLPEAVWLPEIGRGFLTSQMTAYLSSNLERLSEGDLAKPIVVFCVADCWMSWNAAQRIADMGYLNVNWFRLGTDGWLDEGWSLEPVDPTPVDVD